MVPYVKNQVPTHWNIGHTRIYRRPILKWVGEARLHDRLQGYDNNTCNICRTTCPFTSDFCMSYNPHGEYFHRHALVCILGIPSTRHALIWIPWVDINKTCTGMHFYGWHQPNMHWYAFLGMTLTRHALVCIPWDDINKTCIGMHSLGWHQQDLHWYAFLGMTSTRHVLVCIPWDDINMTCIVMHSLGWQKQDMYWYAFLGMTSTRHALLCIPWDDNNTSKPALNSEHG